MKKALFAVSMAATSIALAFAQSPVITVGSVAQQNAVNGGALLQLLAFAQEIVARLVPFAIGVAVLAFFWFLIKFVFNGGDPGAKNEALKGMGYSILALFVMVSIWGIIGFLGSIFGIGQGGSVPTPGIPRPATP